MPPCLANRANRINGREIAWASSLRLLLKRTLPSSSWFAATVRRKKPTPKRAQKKSVERRTTPNRAGIEAMSIHARLIYRFVFSARVATTNRTAPAGVTVSRNASRAPPPFFSLPAFLCLASRKSERRDRDRESRRRYGKACIRSQSIKLFPSQFTRRPPLGSRFLLGNDRGPPSTNCRPRANNSITSIWLIEIFFSLYFLFLAFEQMKKVG